MISIASRRFSLGAVRWWLFKRWIVGWRIAGWCAGGPHVAGRRRGRLGLIRKSRGRRGWKDTGMLKVISRIWWQVRRAMVVGIVGCHLRTSIVRNSWMGIFNRTVQCWESWVHILKASKDSGSDDAQEQPNDVEDGGRPEQVVEVDDILAAADIDVLVVPTSDLHTVAAVVEVTAEASVSPNARCAESTTEVRAVHNVSGSKDSINYGTTKGCNHTKADKDDRSHQHLPFVLNKI